MSGTVVLYGIRNCDTMKKAFHWLDAHGVAYGFHDYKKLGVPPGLLEGWAERLGWEALLNRAGTTFRKLPEAEREGLDAPRALALLRAHPSAIKRPVLEARGRLLLGFAPDAYDAAFA
ncbi:arsenate reductase [Falsiroseomonas tokyonensis]|uniref:Arsenate reductase n=1 Tax=Falsiroseomonas tokyonensis TaxID=430521 RepID=A0ABV7BUY4_9PROT|nr:arsenate reductase [Falsiroseomonas tokyonensis]MBU8537855.1 arsenate reductase [Falsiroseomonas tokyonensis]